MSRVAATVLLGIAATVTGCGSGSHADAADAAPEAPAVVDAASSDSGPDAALTNDATSAEDSGDGWTRYAPSADCEFFLAGPAAKEALPPLMWTACGPGCAVADATPSGFLTTSWAGALGEERDGDVLLQLDHLATVYDNGATRKQLTRLSDGATLVAVETRQSGCFFLGNGVGDAAFIGLGDRTATNMQGGLATIPSGDVTFSSWLPLPGILSGIFSLDGSFGITSSAGDVLLASPASSSWSQIASEPDGADWPFGRGGRLVWSAPAADGTRAVRSFTVARGVETLVGGTAMAKIAVLSDTRLVWVNVHGPDAPSGIFTSGEIAWSNLPIDAVPVPITTGPQLPYVNGFNQLQSFGDYAATIGCAADGHTCEVAVVRFSTGELTRIKPRTGMGFNRILAISSAELVLAETGELRLSAEFRQIRRVMRLRLDQLTAIAGSW